MSSFFSTVCVVFLVAALGYFLGSIKVKGISLGSAGVLIAALGLGMLASAVPYIELGECIIPLYVSSDINFENGHVLAETKSRFSLISDLGIALFVSSVGLIAGPKFFRSFSRKSLGYILMGVITISIATLMTVSILSFSRDPNVDSSLMIGLMTGGLTSTPGFSAAKEVAENADKVTAGYGIAYLFGVLGKVLFIQLVPRILNIDIAKERETYVAANAINIPEPRGKLRTVDAYSIFPLTLTIIFGCLIGSIKIPGINFSFGSAGGMLIAGLIIGHFGHIGPLDCRVNKGSLNLLRELGLCLFFIGAGVSGGVNFIANIRLSYFLYGATITLIPMIVGFLVGRYVFKMSIFNNLGSVAGGMTSTPALGALILVSGTEEVSSAYAATYPFALFFIVVSARIIAAVL